MSILCSAALLLLAAPAQAHFLLISPESFAEQNALGDPQKNPPCGQYDTIENPTGIVTTYEEGSVISVTIDEAIYHPGHYRVAIAESPELLPDTPPVTAGSTACGSTVIDESPTLPILADGMIVHDSAFSSNQTFDVQLPEGFTCDNCTLQVVQFMSNHGLNNPGGCFYHHCATVSVVPAGGGDDVGVDDVGADDVGTDDDVIMDDTSEDDAAETDVGDTGANTNSGADEGCMQASTPDQPPLWAFGMLGLAVAGLGRRRR